jgi:hypothetical protein
MGQIYELMDWKNGRLRSCILIAELVVSTLLAQILLHYIHLLREFIVYKVERGYRVQLAEKDAEERRREQRRHKVNHLLDTCDSEQLFDYVIDHMELFNEVMKELDERKGDANALVALEAKLADVEKNREEDELREQVQKRLQANITKNIKAMNEENDEDPEKGTRDPLNNSKFVNFMASFVRAVKERKRVEAEIMEKLEREASSGIGVGKGKSGEVRPKGERNPREDVKNKAVPNLSASMAEYIYSFNTKMKHVPSHIGVVGKKKSRKKKKKMTLKKYEEAKIPKETDITFTG